jgi:succinate dehydrogenase/fumarate reductase flavoprotein subunit
MPMPAAPREADCDLLVIGSGAAGLSAAVTAAWHGLRVVVVEKDTVSGRATAWSGGWMWVPLNPLSQAEGIVEDPELPRTFLRYVLGDRYDKARVDAFLEAGPHMVAFFDKHTALQLVSGTWIADIQDAPGAGTGGRSVGPKPYNGRTATRFPACTPPAATRRTCWAATTPPAASTSGQP